MAAAANVYERRPTMTTTTTTTTTSTSTTTSMTAQLSGTALVIANRAREHAAIDAQARAFQSAAQARYDTTAHEGAHMGQALLRRIMAFDQYASFIISRDTSARRAMVRRVRAFLEDKYRRAFENAEDTEFRDSMTRLFELAEQRSPMANVLQMYIIHVAVLLEPEISRALCPAPPDPDDADAVDGARVNRLAFTLFEQRYLLPAFLDLSDGSTLNVISFVINLNAAYTSILPSNPIDAVVRTRNRRRIDFPDERANDAIIDAMSALSLSPTQPSAARSRLTSSSPR